MMKKISFQAFGILCLIAVTSVGCGGEGDAVPVPAGIEKLNFILEVTDGGVRLGGNQSAHFHADAVNPGDGEFINVDKDLTLVNGRHAFTHTLGKAIQAPADGSTAQISDFFTSIEVGENGYAEGAIDTSRVSISTDGKTATIYVSFDLSNPNPGATAALLRNLRTRSTGQHQYALASNSHSDQDQSGFSAFSGHGNAPRNASSVEVAL